MKPQNHHRYQRGDKAVLFLQKTFFAFCLNDVFCILTDDCLAVFRRMASINIWPTFFRTLEVCGMNDLLHPHVETEIFHSIAFSFPTWLLARS